MVNSKTKGEPEESNRMWASASFVGVLIVIGLPLWWKTTEVYRVSLPYDKISSFDTLSHSITTELTVLANDEATAAEIIRQIEYAFKDSDVTKLKITKSLISKQLLSTLDAVADEHEAVEEVGAVYDLTKHNTFYVVQRKPLFQDTWLAGDRIMFFRDAKDYIGSFVDELSVLHNFTLKSQWLHLLDFDFQAKEVKDTSDWGRHFAVRQDRLHLLLTKLEERTATHVSELPTINLALYAVPCERAPLVIYDSDGKKVASHVQAFMSPKWGGVVLGGPSEADCRDANPVWKPNVRVIMGTFISQLRKLLGITDAVHVNGAHLEPLRSVTPRQWEIDNLLRIRTLEQLTSAERTLQSLAQLLGEISNIVINDEVGASINSAVESIQRASELMARGDLLQAYNMSQSAFLAAETAFMEPSLLALLYFPDDQKYAIYIPLFLPIMFPVVLSLKNLLLWFRGKPIHKEKTE
ncbi:unnamed protein product [Spodoptera exigua]|nr:unnamed protein product [Spodoptera exigua]